jgi:hypothetical protein
MAGSLGAFEVAFEARGFEVEVASGENWNFGRLMSELAMPPISKRTLAIEHI